MDREALVWRNRTLTEAFHTTPIKHRIRALLLKSLSHLPPPLQRPIENERILLIRPDHLGDVLLATPALHALRHAIPHAELHALVGPWSAEVLSHSDQIDQVLTLPFPGFARGENKNWRFPYKLALSSATQLRRIGYSSAVILRPDHWWGAMLTFLAGIPIRIGYNHGETKPFLTHVVKHQHEHAVEKNLRLIEHWTGPMTLESPVYHFETSNPADHTYIENYLQNKHIPPERNIICIHPGSGTWVKRWSTPHWAQVADTLYDQLDASIVFTGGDHELALVRDITFHMQKPACVMIGDTQLGQLAALLQRALVVLGPDSGPLHLAAAVGTPTVALFGPADPVEFRQWGPSERHAILTTAIGCRPCRVLDWEGDNPDYHPCVREITVGRVLEAARLVVDSRSIL